MPAEKSKSNLRAVKAWQRDAARAEYLRHPDASISDVARATGVALRTVARAREVLVKEGLLAPGRNSPISGADAAALALAARIDAHDAPLDPAPEGAPPPDEGESAPPASAAPTRAARSGQTIDGEALRQMNEMLDGLADEDDETTRKRMLRQVKRFAFDPTLHTDTRMTATQLWAKLLDMARAKDLGPGKPLTALDATARVRDVDVAVGVRIAVAGLFAAFTTEQVLAEVNLIFAGGTSEGNVPAEPGQAPPGDAGASPAPGDAPDLRPAQDGGTS
jgi:hypothetical protein